MIDFLQKFKTQPCSKCDYHSSMFYYRCQNYHSELDQRRKPFDDQGKLIYNSQYIVDNRQDVKCKNYIQYQYHPNIYKTIKCKTQNCKQYYLICPYYHDNLDQKTLLANITERQIKSFINQLQQLKNIYSISSIDNLIELDCYKQIDKISKKLQDITIKKIIKNTNKPSQQQKSMTNVSRDNKQIKKQIINKQVNHDYQHQYTYFQYGQQLDLIQDRHHQFKIFNDFVINDLVFLIVKYITGFLNSQGGVLYLGIDDHSIVYGINISQKQFDKLLLGIDNDGKNRTIPPLMPQKYQIRRIPVYNYRKQQLYVIEIKVKKNQCKDKVLTMYNRDCYMRMNASTHRLSILDYIEYQRVNNLNLTQYQLTDDQISQMSISQIKQLQKKLSKRQLQLQKNLENRNK